ncbi:hem peroxidase [Dillenia turbinata]|uniref:peroxidase n=1 Tax=Dillenia turbinata TaxID=194707 RepID=A0AAN8V8S4_9MAGN
MSKIWVTVKGCDGSILIDNSSTIEIEKNIFPNVNFAKGFDVFDKAAQEDACGGTISCSDILAIAAEVSVSVVGRPSWAVLLGRRDSLIVNKSGAKTALP